MKIEYNNIKTKIQFKGFFWWKRILLTYDYQNEEERFIILPHNFIREVVIMETQFLKKEGYYWKVSLRHEYWVTIPDWDFYFKNLYEARKVYNKIKDWIR